ncbi:hypothetical protein M422DRAFT_246934 [Sphaerobolus stellatus SS14]|nr:hypothetical protein M422DRAFT_246934 [Sphaerobolus stellatus SS14]
MSLLKDFLQHTDLTRFLWSYAIEATSSLPILLPKLFEYSPKLQELQIIAYSDVFKSRNMNPPFILAHKQLSMHALRAVCLSLDCKYENSTAITSSIMDFQLSFQGSGITAVPQFLQQGSWSNIARVTLAGNAF